MYIFRTVCNKAKLLWYGFLNILLKLWWLFVIFLFIILLPILIFLPRKIMLNFAEIVTNFALKILWLIWRMMKCSFFIALALVLIPLTPVLIICARLCGTLWAWIVSGGKPTLETKKRVYAVLAIFGFFLMIIFGILGLTIGCISGEFLAPFIGGIAGFLLWFFATRDCFDLHDQIENELNFAHRPYYFADSCTNQNILVTVSSSAPPPECAKNSDPTSPPLSSSESDCGGNESPSRPVT